MATGHVDRTAQDLAVRHQTVLTGLCEVRDALTALSDEGSRGAVTHDTYAERFNDLHDQRSRLERLQDDIEREVATLAQMEDDPVNHTDELLEKYTQLPRPQFTF